MDHRPSTNRLGSISPATALLPLRVFLGVTFIYAGIQKLSDPGYLTKGASSYIGTQLQQFAHGTPGGFLLRALAIPHPTLTGVLTALAELFIGILVVAGFLTQVAALVGLGFNLLLFLTNSWNTYPYFLGSDIVFVFAWLPFVLAGAAGQPAVDTMLARRDARPRTRRAAPRPVAPSGGQSRRSVLGAGLGTAAGATGLLALVAIIIKAQRGPAKVLKTAQLTGGGAETKTTSTSASSTRSTSRTRAAGIPTDAVRLGPSSRLARGQAALYRDPGDQSPDIVVRTATGHLSALSAVCTHAGCECQFQPGAVAPELVCPCHGSRFNALTGAVIQGPAVQPLPRRTVLERGGVIYAVRA